MKKRILSLLLLVCMLVTAIPVFAFPATAATATAEEITVSFRLGDGREAGYNGSLVAERKIAVGFASFELPTDAECVCLGISPSDLLGWYNITPDGTVIDARAYIGTYLTEDITFYPIMKSSDFGLVAGKNTPYISAGQTHSMADANCYTILGVRGGFNAGYTDDKGAFHPFDVIPTSFLATCLNPSGKFDAWSYGGAYYATPSGGGSSFVLSGNASRVVSLQWKAIAAGKIDLDFSDFTFLNGAAGAAVANCTAYIAVSKNGEIIWPTGATYASSGFAGKGWYEIKLGNGEATKGNYAVKIEGGSLADIAVNGGDEIVIHIGKSNISTVDLAANVTYTKVGAYAESIITSLPAYSVPDVFSATQIPVTTAPSDTEPEVTVNGKWDWIHYANYSEILTGASTSIAYYTKSDATKNAFLTSIKDYGSAGAAPSTFQYGLPVTDWGNLYSIAVQGGKTAGFRYTAEFTGHLDISFAEFLRGSLGWANASKNIRTAIFIDGVMVWPNANSDPTDIGNWYNPWPSGAPNSGALQKGVDISAEMNATLPSGIFVRAGQKVEFLVTSTGGSIWDGAAITLHPAISYQTAYIANFSASATLGEKLALNFTASNSTQSFVPGTDTPYLLADTLKIELTNAPEGVTVGEQKTVEGGIIRTVSEIDARMMNDKIGYRLTATAKIPGGEDTVLTLAEGSISVADYLASLAENATTPTKDLVNATLAYGAASQKFFGYRTDSLPVAGSLSFVPEAATDVTAQTEGGTYRFKAATLLLQDALKLKLFIDATDAAITAPLYLTEKSSNVRIPLLPRGESTDGSEYKAIVEIPYAKFGTTYEFTVVDGEGNPVSSTLTYSVGSYAVRMAGNSKLTEVLTAIRALGQAAENYIDATKPTDRGNTVTRMVVLSDAHIGETLTNASGKLESTLRQIIAMGGADTILFTGDMTNNGIDAEYDELFRIIEDAELSQATERMSFVLGNHEHYRAGYKTSANTQAEKDAVTAVFNKYFSKLFTEELGYTTANNGLDHTLILDGMYIIGLGERDCVGLYGEEVEAYLRKQVKAAAEADPTKPIFVYSHIGYGAIEGSSHMNVSQETKDFLKNYPQLVWITGHTHYSSYNPAMIQQGDFTNIQAPTSGSKQWWVYSSGYQHPASYAYEVQEGIIIEVTDTNVVIAQRYDFGTGKPIGQEWVIDIPAILKSTDNFTYRLADRKSEAAVPTWKETDTVTATELKDTYMTVSFPRAHIDDLVSDDAVEYYRLVAIDPNGKTVFSTRYLAEYYRGARQTENYTFTINGLEPSTEYRVIAMAESIFGKISEGLEARISTAEKEIFTLDGIEKLLDVDYRTGSIEDAYDHGVSVDKTDGAATLNSPGEGYPILSKDGITFDNSYGVGYYAPDVKQKMDDSFTIETVVTMLDKAYTNNAWGWVGIVGNEESGGFGLNYYYNNGYFLFALNLVNANGEKLAITLQAPCAEGVKAHIVATYDGKTVALYLNGELVASQIVGEGYTVRHATATDMIYVGANAWNGKSSQCPAHALIEYATVYEQGVSAGQASLLYANYLNPPIEETPDANSLLVDKVKEEEAA